MFYTIYLGSRVLAFGPMMLRPYSHATAACVKTECRTLADSLIRRQVKVITNVEGTDECSSYPDLLPRHKAPSSGDACPISRTAHANPNVGPCIWASLSALEDTRMLIVHVPLLVVMQGYRLAGRRLFPSHSEAWGEEVKYRTLHGSKQHRPSSTSLFTKSSLRSVLRPYHAILSPHCCCRSRCSRRHRPCRRRDPRRAHGQPVSTVFWSEIHPD